MLEDRREDPTPQRLNPRHVNKQQTLQKEYENIRNTNLKLEQKLEADTKKPKEKNLMQEKPMKLVERERL